MCGIFGIIGNSTINIDSLNLLASAAEQRGKDSSGLIVYDNNRYGVYKADFRISKLIPKINFRNINVALGHSRLITNGLLDNQPVIRDDIIVLHNGIIVNDNQLWQNTRLSRKFSVDTEILNVLAFDFLNSGEKIEGLADYILNKCIGVVSCAIILPKIGKLILISNNGSLYYGVNGSAVLFSSERFPLESLGADSIIQIKRHQVILDLPVDLQDIFVKEFSERTTNLIPKLGEIASEERMLEYKRYTGIRCSKCILPETMPFIKFDENGVCNYCLNYKPRNSPKPIEELYNLLKPYRRAQGDDCIIPFSGGRDSCFGLHLVCKELNMKPITYTYDWGMVTDLGRRNISRMSSQLGVENIIIADDISMKRSNIAKNFKAWLKSPSLGMVSILTAGDKHFFKHVDTVRKQTGISLNLWGVNPLEVTHFKAGFLGVPPDFEEKKVYTSSMSKQIRYQYLRFKEMSKSLGYFNSSLYDTISGEYYRSFNKKIDYFHIFDYWRWDECEIDSTLINLYDWETAPDTKTTWRIGDGTAAIYNYIYYTVAGFTEHDTFRSNQIREGDITREDALALVEDENLPRYPNIKWYLDAISMNYEDVINKINSIPKLYNNL